jgi:hypothetical protein
MLYCISRAFIPLGHHLNLGFLAGRSDHLHPRYVQFYFPSVRTKWSRLALGSIFLWSHFILVFFLPPLFFLFQLNMTREREEKVFSFVW